MAFVLPLVIPYIPAMAGAIVGSGITAWYYSAPAEAVPADGAESTPDKSNKDAKVDSESPAIALSPKSPKSPEEDLKTNFKKVIEDLPAAAPLRHVEPPQESVPLRWNPEDQLMRELQKSNLRQLRPVSVHSGKRKRKGPEEKFAIQLRNKFALLKTNSDLDELDSLF